jgi:hypothetical protein
MPSFDWLEEMIKQYRATAARAGRDVPEVVFRAFTVVLDQSPTERQPMVGTLDDIKEDMQRLRDIGVTHLIHSPSAIGFTSSASVDDGLVLMERLIEASR